MGQQMNVDRERSRTVRIMTFNIRCNNPSDGINSWTNRKELVLEELRAIGADVVGLQEVQPSQMAALRNGLGDRYGHISRTREADPTRGEAVPIFYRTDRWTPDPGERGTFWLSQTPDEPGSRSWETVFPRIATWARLIERERGQGLYVFNLHLDNLSDEARQRGIQVLLERVARRARADEPVIILGDFNAPSRQLAIRMVADAGFVDVYAELHGLGHTTIHRFTGETDTDRIDYIFASPQLRPRDAQIIRTERNGIYLSDHFPVLAELGVPR